MTRRRSPRRHQVHPRHPRYQVDQYPRGSNTLFQENFYRQNYLEMDSKWRQPNQVEDVPEGVWSYAYLSERSATPHENPLRYIDVTFVDAPTLDNMRDDREYFKKAKGTDYEIKLVSPEEYYRLSSEMRNGLNGRRERGEVNDKRARKMADAMLKGDKKFAMPWIDFDYRGQEGRHRARALEMIGVKFFPVMIVRGINDD